MNHREMIVASSQIGAMNIMATSGGRLIVDGDDLLLPVSSGYRVRVHLAGDDTYTVTREMKRGAKLFVKGVETGVYFDQLGDSVYRAGCYKNVPFGAHTKTRF